jgi:hypothetical protein
LIVNSLCDTIIKADRLISVLNQVQSLQFRFVSIRARGKFSMYIESNLENSSFASSQQMVFRSSDTYRSWKANTLEQIIFDGPHTEYVFLLQEDYRLMVEPPILESYFNFGKISGHDNMLLLAGPYYGFLGPSIDEFLLSPRKFTFSYYVDRLNAKKTTRVIHSFTGWPSIFATKTAILALTSFRPFLKRFPPDLPFDFEKSAKATWILPQRYLCPRFEMFACIDDDILFPGSSLQSRALSQDSEIRSSQQDNNFAQNIFNISLPKNILGRSNMASKVVSKLDPKFLVRHNLKKSLRYLVNLYYSAWALVNSLTRKEEYILRNSAKKVLNRPR